MNEQIEIGYQTFINDGDEEFGAVRKVSPGGQPNLSSMLKMLANSSFRLTPSNRCIPEKSFWITRGSTAASRRLSTMRTTLKSRAPDRVAASDRKI
jgi:hypothetical protein